MNGLINLFKPSGISSQAAVTRVKRILGERTVGHMGTLDPMAEGVLAVGVGKSARLFDYLCGRDKTYIAKFSFGYETDTLDALGAVVSRTADIPSVDAVGNAMQSLVGEIEQIPPAFSAKHVAGKRAYALARSGEKVELRPVKVTIRSASLVSQPAMNEFIFEICCSSGTYIRSICRDVAAMCGSLATLTFLRRTRSGKFDVSDSITPENLGKLGQAALIPPSEVIDLPRYDVSKELYEDLVFGRKIPCTFADPRAIYGNGELFGIGCAADGVLKIKTYLRD